MTESHGHARLCEEIKRELSAIVEFEARDPALRQAFPTVMAVKLSPDARYAKVYVAIGSSAVDKHTAMAAFRRDRGFFRSQLAKHLPIRYTPELEFILDETVEKALHIDQLLHDEESHPPDPH
jgi:ribosome-binding factor A